MSVAHPSAEIPQELVDKVVGRRGRLHVYDDLDPRKTALVVIDMDIGSCAREPGLTAAAIDRINLISGELRRAGGTVAFVTSRIVAQIDLARRLGDDAAARYVAETQPGGDGTVLEPDLLTKTDDLHACKAGASAFFPGRCDLHDQLQEHEIRSLLIAGLVTNVCCESPLGTHVNSATRSRWSLMPTSGTPSACTKHRSAPSSASSVTFGQPSTSST